MVAGLMPGMGRRKMVDGAEYDAYTAWRHLLIYTGRAGVVKRIKRSTHKRERREARNETRADG